ncbi:MAG: hypothetical protein CM15mP125_1410 [Gammaproteobacteria bacterium]|nr:MAG: hypothetical protein CM15mP125_1410 [Gammaproteobacteria bacterium]
MPSSTGMVLESGRYLSIARAVRRGDLGLSKSAIARS